MIRSWKPLHVWQFYTLSLVQLLIEPGIFFKEVSQKAGYRKTLGFLAITCGFFTAATLLTGIFSGPLWYGGLIVFAGTFGMVLISSALGYIATVAVAGKTVCFSEIFKLYVFSHGITLFLSWLPFLLWLTEVWKYWLVYTGFKTMCRIKGKQALFILAISITTQFFLMYSANMAFSA